MEQRTDAWVVIPAYNEAPVIGGVVTGVHAAFPHVLVVDDASSDDTAAIARSEEFTWERAAEVHAQAFRAAAGL